MSSQGSQGNAPRRNVRREARVRAEAGYYGLIERVNRSAKERLASHAEVVEKLEALFADVDYRERFEARKAALAAESNVNLGGVPGVDGQIADVRRAKFWAEKLDPVGRMLPPRTSTDNEDPTDFHNERVDIREGSTDVIRVYDHVIDALRALSGDIPRRAGGPVGEDIARLRPSIASLQNAMTGIMRTGSNARIETDLKMMYDKIAELRDAEGADIGILWLWALRYPIYLDGIITEIMKGEGSAAERAENVIGYADLITLAKTSAAIGASDDADVPDTDDQMETDDDAPVPKRRGRKRARTTADAENIDIIVAATPVPDGVFAPLTADGLNRDVASDFLVSRIAEAVAPAFTIGADDLKAQWTAHRAPPRLPGGMDGEARAEVTHAIQEARAEVTHAIQEARKRYSEIDGAGVLRLLGFAMRSPENLGVLAGDTTPGSVSAWMASNATQNSRIRAVLRDPMFHLDKMADEEGAGETLRDYEPAVDAFVRDYTDQAAELAANQTAFDRDTATTAGDEYLRALSEGRVPDATVSLVDSAIMSAVARTNDINTAYERMRRDAARGEDTLTLRDGTDLRSDAASINLREVLDHVSRLAQAARRRASAKAHPPIYEFSALVRIHPEIDIVRKLNESPEWRGALDAAVNPLRAVTW